MKHQFMTALLAMSFSAIAVHAETYTWKDTNGKTHFGDQVPPAYKDTATLIDLPTINTTQPEEAIRIQNQKAADRLKRQDKAERDRQKRMADKYADKTPAKPKLTKEQCRDMRLRTVKEKTACFREAYRQANAGQ